MADLTTKYVDGEAAYEGMEKILIMILVLPLITKSELLNLSRYELNIK